MPLRIAGGLHWLCLTGEDQRLAPVYPGVLTDQAAIDAIVVDMVAKYDAPLDAVARRPAADQRGRALGQHHGRAAVAFAAARAEVRAQRDRRQRRRQHDDGAAIITISAGCTVGPETVAGCSSPRNGAGRRRRDGKVEIVAMRGSDIAPIDLTDPAQALRLKAYVWPEATERMARIDTAIAMAERAPPDLAQHGRRPISSAQMLARPQREGVTRVLFHSVMWQYLPRGHAAGDHRD